MARWLRGSVARWLGGSVARWLGGSVARWLGGSVARWLGGSVARWLGGSVARWLGGSVARWLGGSVARWLSGSVATASDSGLRGRGFESPVALSSLDQVRSLYIAPVYLAVQSYRQPSWVLPREIEMIFCQSARK